jgi:hypothetical protein
MLKCAGAAFRDSQIGRLNDPIRHILPRVTSVSNQISPPTSHSSRSRALRSTHLVVRHPLHGWPTRRDSEPPNQIREDLQKCSGLTDSMHAPVHIRWYLVSGRQCALKQNAFDTMHSTLIILHERNQGRTTPPQTPCQMRNSQMLSTSHFLKFRPHLSPPRSPKRAKDVCISWELGQATPHTNHASQGA